MDPLNIVAASTALLTPHVGQGDSVLLDLEVEVAQTTKQN